MEDTAEEDVLLGDIKGLKKKAILDIHGVGESIF